MRLFYGMWTWISGSVVQSGLPLLSRKKLSDCLYYDLPCSSVHVLLCLKIVRLYYGNDAHAAWHQIYYALSATSKNICFSTTLLWFELKDEPNESIGSGARDPQSAWGQFSFKNFTYRTIITIELLMADSNYNVFEIYKFEINNFSQESTIDEILYVSGIVRTTQYMFNEILQMDGKILSKV